MYYIGTEVLDQKRNSTMNIRLYKNLKNVHNFSQIFEQNIHEAFKKTLIKKIWPFCFVHSDISYQVTDSQALNGTLKLQIPQPPYQSYTFLCKINIVLVYILFKMYVKLKSIFVYSRYWPIIA